MLGKRLSSFILALKSGDVIETGDFIAMVDPFPQLFLEQKAINDDPSASQSDVEDNTADTMKGAFDPLKPCLRELDGSVESKFPMVVKFLLSDVIPALITLGPAGVSKGS